MKIKILILIISLEFCTPIFSETVYNSNILGMQLDQIDSIDDAKGEYYLVSLDDINYTKRLFKGNELIFTISTSFDNNKTIEVIEKDNEKETIITKDGIIISESRQKTDSKTELIKYNYKNLSIDTVEHYLEKELLYQEKYYYTKNGRLLEVVRSYKNEESTIFSISYKQEKLSSYMLMSKEGTSYLEFNSYGIVYSNLSGTKLGNEKREYGQLSGNKHFVLITNNTTGQTQKIIYDKDDKILQRTERDADGSFLKEQLWSYQGELVKSLKIRHKSFFELFEYNYRNADQLEDMTYYRNGIIMQKTFYTDKKNYTERLYRYEKPVLEITYKDGKRISTIEVKE